MTTSTIENKKLLNNTFIALNEIANTDNKLFQKTFNKAYHTVKNQPDDLKDLTNFLTSITRHYFDDDDFAELSYKLNRKCCNYAAKNYSSFNSECVFFAHLI